LKEKFKLKYVTLSYFRIDCFISTGLFSLLNLTLPERPYEPASIKCPLDNEHKNFITLAQSIFDYPEQVLRPEMLKHYYFLITEIALRYYLHNRISPTVKDVEIFIHKNVGAVIEGTYGKSHQLDILLILRDKIIIIELSTTFRINEVQERLNRKMRQLQEKKIPFDKFYFVCPVARLGLERVNDKVTIVGISVLEKLVNDLF